MKRQLRRSWRKLERKLNDARTSTVNLFRSNSSYQTRTISSVPSVNIRLCYSQIVRICVLVIVSSRIGRTVKVTSMIRSLQVLTVTMSMFRSSRFSASHFLCLDRRSKIMIINLKFQFPVSSANSRSPITSC